LSACQHRTTHFEEEGCSEGNAPIHNHNKIIMSARRKERKRQQKAILPAAPPASGFWHSERKSVADRCTAYIILRLVHLGRSLLLNAIWIWLRRILVCAVPVGKLRWQAQGACRPARRVVFFVIPALLAQL
jgi:hypothetical protein